MRLIYKKDSCPSPPPAHFLLVLPWHDLVWVAAIKLIWCDQLMTYELRQTK